MTETQQRFLKAIAERLGEREVMEVRLFPSIRQGQHESGVAVVAVEESGVENPESGVQSPEGPSDAAGNEQSGRSHQPSAISNENQLQQPAPVTSTSTQHPAEQPATSSSHQPPATSHQPERYTILTARFRLTVKGADRGRWEFSLVHDADAPLETIEPVVRGVARRVGDAGEPELLSPSAFQRAVTEPWWSTTV